MLHYETKKLKSGVNLIAGVDEAGRGPLAGPLVAAAVILDLESINPSNKVTRNNDVVSDILGGLWSEINDSKKLTQKKRGELYEFIITNAVSFSIVEISSIQIDKQGIAKANKNALYQAVKDLKIQPQHILSDYFKIDNLPQQMQTNITKGDSLSLSIAAASILAKVHRDNIMQQMHLKYPQYGFDTHKGYGTKAHKTALSQFGPCEIHRRSFAPIKLLSCDVK
jgi:ribonuclease HII